MPGRHTRKRGGWEHSREEQRQHEENDARRQARARREAGIPGPSRPLEPPARPAFASPLRRNDATHDGSLPPAPIVPQIGPAPADGHLMSDVATRPNFSNAGGRKRRHRKTKKSTRRHRRR